MQLTLILILVIIALLVIIIALAKVCRKAQVDKARTEKDLQKQKENTIYLAKHAEELAQIQKDEKQTEAKISEAKSDEEVLNIINTIIDANNSKLH